MAGSPRCTQPTARLLAATGNPPTRNEHKELNDQPDAAGQHDEACQVLCAKDFLDTDLQQVQHQDGAGVDRGDAGEEPEIGAVKLGGAVEDFAEGKGRRLVSMANPCCRLGCRLGGILAQHWRIAPCRVQGWAPGSGCLREANIRTVQIRRPFFHSEGIFYPGAFGIISSKYPVFNRDHLDSKMHSLFQTERRSTRLLHAQGPRRYEFHERYDSTLLVSRVHSLCHVCRGASRDHPGQCTPERASSPPPPSPRPHGDAGAPFPVELQRHGGSARNPFRAARIRRRSLRARLHRPGMAVRRRRGAHLRVSQSPTPGCCTSAPSRNSKICGRKRLSELRNGDAVSQHKQ